MTLPLEEGKELRMMRLRAEEAESHVQKLQTICASYERDLRLLRTQLMLTKSAIGDHAIAAGKLSNALTEIYETMSPEGT